MKVISPRAVTETTLTASNVTFPDVSAGEIEWTAGSYVAGDQRYVDTTIYEALTNTSDEPTAGELAIPATWLAIGSVNRFKMFDDENQTQTVFADEITGTIEYVGLKDSIALFNVDANEVTIEVTSVLLGGIAYSETFTMIDRSMITGWWTYYKEQRGRKQSLFIENLPAYTDSIINFTVDNSGSDAKCGNFVIGQLTDLGITLSGMNPEIRDTSRYIEDTFGRRTYISRGSVRELTCAVKYKTIKHDSIYRTVEALVGRNAAWIGSELYSTSIIWGKGSFTPSVTPYEFSDATYEIEGAQ